MSPLCVVVSRVDWTIAAGFANRGCFERREISFSTTSRDAETTKREKNRKRFPHLYPRCLEWERGHAELEWDEGTFVTNYFSKQIAEWFHLATPGKYDHRFYFVSMKRITTRHRRNVVKRPWEPRIAWCFSQKTFSFQFFLLPLEIAWCERQQYELLLYGHCWLR